MAINKKGYKKNCSGIVQRAGPNAWAGRIRPEGRSLGTPALDQPHNINLPQVNVTLSVALAPASLSKLDDVKIS